MFRKSKLNSGTHYIIVEICTIHTSMVEQGPVPHVSKYFCSKKYLFSASSMEYISENVDKIYQSVLVLWLFQHLQNLACFHFKGSIRKKLYKCTKILIRQKRKIGFLAINLLKFSIFMT